MTWPTDRPGYPMYADRQGPHWLQFDEQPPTVLMWFAHECGFWGYWDSDDTTPPALMGRDDVRYLGPCPTPDDLDAAVQAEREACATQLDMMRKAHNDALIGQPHTPDTSIAYGNGAAAIRARGPTPALDAALSQARREGMEEERKAWAAMWARYRNPVAFSEAMQKHIAIRSAAAGEEGK